MGIRASLTVLKKECEFLGLSMSSLFIMIKRNPYAFPNRTIEAYKIYTGAK
tara:strand:- start:34779 stop:34931 length:153 start_codon:yes stop_codon:yes gene_type:complete